MRSAYEASSLSLPPTGAIETDGRHTAASLDGGGVVGQHAIYCDMLVDYRSGDGAASH